MKQQEKYLQDLELLKKLNPIMERLGVECDGYYDVDGEFFDEAKIYVWLNDKNYVEEVHQIIEFGTKTYRLDTLLLVLPRIDVGWKGNEYGFHIGDIWHGEILPKKQNDHILLTQKLDNLQDILIDYVCGTKDIEEALKACGELIILLDSEGIELKGENDV